MDYPLVGISKLVLLLAAATLLLLELDRPALAQQTNNYALRAVPAPARVALDGELGEWDLSGEILMCYDLETMLDNHSVRTAAMYDQEWLYLSFRFRDRTPMVNHVNPQQRPGSGWIADCVQVRIWADDGKPLGPGGARITHIDCYYFTDEKRPTAYVTYNDMSRKQDGLEGTIPEAIGQGVEAAFLQDPDGQGYTQEMRISCKHLRREGRPYVAGETLRLGLECFWGGPEAEKWYEHRLTDLLNPELPQREFFWTNYNAWGRVQFMDHGKLEPSPSLEQLSDVERLAQLRYSTDGPVAIRYRMPLDGFATLVVEKPDGTRIRNLISNYPRKQGNLLDRWDGTDDNGRLVPPGNYQVRGLYHGPLDILYQFSYGNPGNPPWETSDGKGNWLQGYALDSGWASDGGIVARIRLPGLLRWQRSAVSYSGEGGDSSLAAKEILLSESTPLGRGTMPDEQPQVPAPPPTPPAPPPPPPEPTPPAPATEPAAPDPKQRTEPYNVYRAKK